MVCEFITGGGLSDATLPASLVKEGVAMRDALLNDLDELKQYQVITMHDARLSPSAYAKNSLAVKSGDFEKVFKNALKQADLVWLIAPEAEGKLLALTELCLAAEDKENGSILLGCGYDSTLIGTSKSLSFEAMQAAGINTLPVYAGEDLMLAEYFDVLLQLNIKKWVVKPEDGVGCEGIQSFDSLEDLRSWLVQEDRYLHYFAQPFQAGIVASFSMICRESAGWLLSCNQQHIQYDGNQFKLIGITINGMQTYWQRFETLARKIARMLPDALGYVGVDVIIDENDKIFVIDINPRLTSSYAGLREATGRNPAQIILACILQPHFKFPTLQKNIVEIEI